MSILSIFKEKPPSYNCANCHKKIQSGFLKFKIDNERGKYLTNYIKLCGCCFGLELRVGLICDDFIK